MASKRGSFGATVAVGLALVAAWSCLWRHADEDFVTGVSVQPRESVVARCAVDKAMKDRLASVAKTAKLTDAMRVVAAAKVRNAQNGVEKQRPFTDELLSMIKGLVKRLKGSGFEAELPMLRVPEKVTNVGILMITANRGLYEQAGADVKESLSGWAKQQEAALAEDQDEVDRLRKALEEARR
ncbi:atpG [Symbiodinium pilosum]|uniref:AtpG protein n=1 Tax=Symbiodinium pilosum TaxID=2952 RepID=A0A812SJW5_SYMPI|nr:atpG [Symbiodinium pilosum]